MNTQERLKHLLAKKGIRVAGAADEPAPRPAGEESPLSFAQERLWFLHRLDPGSRAYHLTQTFRLRGRVDAAALGRAVDRLLIRHEALRSGFVAGPDGRARVAPAAPPSGFLRTEDLSALPAARREPEAAGREARLFDESFDLAAPPLFRALLLRLGPEEHRLAFCVHHLVFDGWSIALLARDLAAFYAEEAGDAPRKAPSSGLGYADYAAWQRRRASEPAWGQALDWWEQRLKGLPPLELPADRPRPSRASGRGAGHRLAVPPAVAGRLRELARREGATLFAVLLAAYQALLGRHAGQEDFGVGVSVAGRTHRSLEDLVGLFVNTVVFRADLSGDPSFAALVRRVRDESAEALARQETPFEQVVDRLDTERDLSRNPLFQAGLFLQNAPAADFRLGSAALDPLPSDHRSAKFDLLLLLEETADGGISGVLEYATELFEAETAARICARLGELLASAAAAPDRRLSELSWLPRAEREEIERWSEGPRDDFPGEGWIHELPDRQPRDAIALTAPDGRRRTYGEFCAEAGRLARALRGMGVGPEVLVGVCLERSAELVVALHAVLRAGGAYVPLDPNYPAERLAWMAGDAGAPVVITTRALLDRLPGCAARMLFIEEPWPDGPAEGPRPEGRHAAYVIYTSGSTGRPKGALNTHEAIRNMLRWIQGAFPLGPGEVFLQKTPCSFDVSVREFFWPLMFGAELAVAEPGAHRDPARVAALVRERGVTLINFVPSVFRAFLDVPEARLCPSLKRVFCTGEELPRDMADKCRERLGRELVNLYGPTEAAVEFTHHTCGPGEGPVPIGRPMANLEVRILDARFRPVPRGVAGEVLLGGIGLARGYRGRPDLTADRWVPHPDKPGARLYRTGDLGRWRAGGEIDYLGRTDFQVKLRGQRIELGEIEAVLREHPTVKETAVAVRDARLVAYVVPRAGAISPEELRAWLGARLPEYMVPPSWVELPALPLNTAGKTDRKALPAPAAAASSGYAAPRGEREELLAECWREVLRVERVGRDDGYFDLGGDSILSIQLQARVRARGWEFDLADLFQHQSLAALAQALRPARAAGAGAPRPFGLVPEADRAGLPPGLDDAYPLSALQAGMVLHAELDPGSSVYREVFSYEVRAPWDEAALRESLGALAARHPVLRTGFALRGFSEPLQLVHAAAPAPFAADDLRALDRAGQDAAARRVEAEELVRGFAWAEPPLWRARALRRSDDSWQFVLAAHHAILDGWSAAALLAELFEDYLERASGRAPRPRAAAPAFARYVALERAAAADERGRAFWRERLAEAPLGRLPRRPDRPGGPRAQASAWRLWKGPELAALQALAARAGASLKHVLLAAHLKASQVLTAQADVVTGAITNGRPEADGAERTLGLFLNTVPLRLRLRPDSWLGLVRSVLRAEEESWPHRRHPLSELQRMHGRRELFETTFNYVHYHGLDALRSRADVRVLDARFLDENSFFYFAQYSLDGVAGELTLELRYDAAEFTAEQADGFAEANAQALAAMIAAPEAPHAARPLLSAAEWHRVARADNERPLPAGGPDLLHAGFLAAAARSPGAVALVHGDSHLTYGKLAARVHAWARRLREAGAGPERLVGVCLERGPDLVAALLAVLESGAAYVPLDPSYPPERLAFLCADAAICALVSRPGLASRLPPGAWTLVDAAELAALRPAAEPPSVAIRPGNLAYLIYTSGSTGRPKAAAIEHRSACALVAWARAEYSEAELAGVLFSTSICFDLSIFELFATLSAGGRVIVAENALELPELPARAQVTLLNTVPSAAAELVRQRAIPASVRTVNLAGEPLTAALADQIYGTGTVSKVYDLYGPSEDTTYSTWGLRRRGGPAHIGRVLPGSTLYLLDEFLQPVPFGAVGEIFLGGAGLARGYLQRPDLTAERWVPDPFSAGGRLYRTGDLARWRVPGELEFLGRSDHQVKIRGFRIELGEIQAALERHPGVAEAAVIAREDEPGRKRLVAYVASAPSAAPAEAALRAWLAERLPEPYVPAAFVFLERLPRTPNGKLDRAALPAPSGAAARSEGSGRPPQTPSEEALARIWRDVLRLPAVGVDDDFFALGGDSILALQVSARARDAGLAVTPRKLFEHPTVAQLAAAAGGGTPGVGASVPLARPSGELTPIQRWFFAQDFAEPHHWNQSLLLKAREPMDADRLERAFAVVGARHPALSRRFERSSDGRWRSQAAEGTGFSFHAEPLPPAKELTARCAQEQASLDLRQGPLARAVWFAGHARDPGRLLLVIHHLAVDGVSWRVLLEELGEVYDALRAGREPGAAAPSADPSAWAGWLKARAAAGGFAAEAAHWSGLAATADPGFLRDHPRGADTVAAARMLSVVLDPSETEALLRRALAAHGCRIDDLLLAALALALRDATGREAHVIELEGHGREGLGSELDLSRSVGWFTALYPVRLDLQGASGAVRALGAVKAQLAAVPNRGLGYGVGRFLADPPLWPEARADLCFNYLGQFDGLVGADARFAPAAEQVGFQSSPRGRRPRLIDVNGMVAGGALRFEWHYPAEILERATVVRLAERHLSHLRALIAAGVPSASRGAPETELDRAISEIEL